jgi:hypothetical protein
MNHLFKIPKYPNNSLFGIDPDDSPIPLYWNEFCLDSTEFPLIAPGRLLGI